MHSVRDDVRPYLLALLDATQQANAHNIKGVMSMIILSLCCDLDDAGQDSLARLTAAISDALEDA